MKKMIMVIMVIFVLSAIFTGCANRDNNRDNGFDLDDYDTENDYDLDPDNDLDWDNDIDRDNNIDRDNIDNDPEDYTMPSPDGALPNGDTNPNAGYPGDSPTATMSVTP